MGSRQSKVVPIALSHGSCNNAFFVSAELSDAAKILSGEGIVRSAFVQYLKSGVWLEQIAKRIPIQEFAGTERCTVDQRKRSTIFEYKVDPSVDLGEVLIRAALSKVEGIFKAFPLSPRSTATDRSCSGATKHSSMDSRDDCYLPLEEICNMSEEKLMAVMTGIIFPMFKESSEWKALKEGSFSDLGRSLASEQSNACLTSSSKRAQELLLSCAARFDEDILLLQLQEPAWLATLQSAFQDFPLPISVCDTNRDTCPLVYVNRAFEELVGRPSRKLLGKRLNVLNGPETELMLLDRVLEAQQCNLPCKVAITHYAANGSERFLDLLALRPSGGYSFAVHCPANRRTLADDLKMVDDVLMLLAYAVPAPPVQKAQGGQPWVPSVSNLRAMSRRLLL